MTAHAQTEPVELPRKAFDEYPTPFLAALAAVRRMARTGVLSEAMTVLEPSVGHQNHWITALRVLELELGWPPFSIMAVDIQETAVRAASRSRPVPGVEDVVVRGADYWHVGDILTLVHTVLAPHPRRGRRFDVALGNPPYAVVVPGKRRGRWVVDQHVQAARSVARWVSFLLQQQAFTSSGKAARVAWATEPATRAWRRGDFVPRLSFTGNSKAPWDSTQATWGPCAAPAGPQAFGFVRWEDEGALDAEALRAAWAERRAA